MFITLLCSTNQAQGLDLCPEWFKHNHTKHGLNLFLCSNIFNWQGNTFDQVNGHTTLGYGSWRSQCKMAVTPIAFQIFSTISHKTREMPWSLLWTAKPKFRSSHLVSAVNATNLFHKQWIPSNPYCGGPQLLSTVQKELTEFGPSDVAIFWSEVTFTKDRPQVQIESKKHLTDRSDRIQ